MKRNESRSFLAQHRQPAPVWVWLLTAALLAVLGIGGFGYGLIFGLPDGL